MSRLQRVLLAAMLVLGLAGCATPAPQPVPSPVPSPTPAPGQGKLHAPGIDRLADGTSEAYGYVRRIELEGGFWALVSNVPQDKISVETSVVVVLLPGRVSEADIAKMAGSYAQAKGTELHGTSIRMAGPEMKVDAIAALREP